MRKLFTLSLLAASLLVPRAAFAWHAPGHKTVAFIAYSTLNESTRAKVDDLLRRHPNYNKWMQGIPDDPAHKMERGFLAFMNAAVWPDDIKSDGQHVNDHCDPQPTNKGFADVKEHRCWHFMDLPLSSDGTATSPPEAPNALVKIVEFREALGNASLSKELRAYDLSWLIHLVGDVHQPLHAAARFSKEFTHGDAGGNSYNILIPFNGKKEPSNLHTYWDALPTTPFDEDDSPKAVAAFGTSLMQEFKVNPAEVNILSDALAGQSVMGWITESAALSEYFVYLLDRAKQGDAPPLVPEDYTGIARDIARRRIAVAGYRLAALVNSQVH